VSAVHVVPKRKYRYVTSRPMQSHQMMIRVTSRVICVRTDNPLVAAGDQHLFVRQFVMLSDLMLM
jgi:hypothetical protein